MEEHLKIIPFKEPELTEEQLQELKIREKKTIYRTYKIFINKKIKIMYIYLHGNFSKN